MLRLSRTPLVCQFMLFIRAKTVRAAIAIILINNVSIVYDFLNIVFLCSSTKIL